MIPNRPAPLLITAEMVKTMKQGSIIVDIAAGDSGGNCELTEKDKIVEKHGVTILGLTDFPSRLANTSSTLFSNNV
jgi:NAD(P) transhydrogenase subunit alpha